jgi:hypothetical protein
MITLRRLLSPLLTSSVSSRSSYDDNRTDGSKTDETQKLLIAIVRRTVALAGFSLLLVGSLSQAQVQTESTKYGAWINFLTVGMTKPQTKGNQIWVAVTHDPAQSVTSVFDISGGDTYKRIIPPGTTNPTTEKWAATNIVGLGWNDAVIARFSANTNNPAMTVSEYSNAAPAPTPAPTPKPTHTPTPTPGQVSLAWDPDTDPNVVGYNLYYTTNPRALVARHVPPIPGSQHKIPNASPTMTTLSGLSSGSQFWFGITAYNTNGIESALSNVVHTKVP